MLDLYNGSVNFMLAQDKLLGADRANKESSQNARIKNFVANLPFLDKRVTDAQAVLDALADDASNAFTADQRKSMAEAVSAHMDSDGAKDSGLVVGSQHHPYVHEAMPDSLWKRLFDKTESWTKKKEAFVDFLIEVLGLRFPDNYTQKLCLSILLICSDKELSPDDTYEELVSFRELFVNKRPLVAGRPLLKDYGDVSQFVKLFPHQYLECDPPIASRIDDRRLQQRMRKDVMPSRSTNKQLTHNKKQKTSHGSFSPGVDSLAASCLQYLLGNNANVPTALHRNNSLTIEDEPPPPAERRAICDAQQVSGAVVGPPLTPATPSKVETVIAEAKAVLTPKGGDSKRAKKGGASKSTPCADDDSDDDSGDSSDETVHKRTRPAKASSPAAPAVKKRPASRAGGPAGGVKNRPASRAGDAAGPPAPSFAAPVHYAGGRIYYNASKRVWRVYRRYYDKVEKPVSVDDADPEDVRKKWKKALNLIKQDPRPLEKK